jgi:hypothetical protein
VRDWRFERRFAMRALDLNVNPLVVERSISKLLDALLGNVEPVGDGDLLADEVFEGVWGIKYAFGHSFV